MREADRLTLADLMALVAATAVGLPLALLFVEALAGKGRTSFQLDPVGHAFWAAGRILLPALPLAGSLSLAVVLVAGWRARSQPRERRATPGFIACLAAVSVSLVGAGSLGLGVYPFPLQPGMTGPAIVFAITLPFMASSAVAGAWIALAACGCWRAEPTWLDRLGRALGIYWLAVLPVASVMAVHH